MKKKIVIAGGSGFLGEAIAKHFKAKGYEITILTRGKSLKENNTKLVHWDAKTLGKWTKELHNASLLINLSGKSVDCRYTEKNKKEILSSRVDSTRILGQAIEAMDSPPPLWMNASTATIYKGSRTQRMDEDHGEFGNDFSMTVAQTWENAFYESKTPNTRKIALRISLVLGKDGGVFPVMKKLVRFGLGGKQGSGTQKFAWIHEEDLLRIIEFGISNHSISGPINCASPDDITNADFMKTLRKAMKMPLGIPSPEFILKIGVFFLGTEPELVLKSRFVHPKRLLENGFEFKYDTIAAGIESVIHV